MTGRLVVADEIATDAQNLALGVYAPLTGFVGREELQSIIEHERLPSGAIFPVPILLTTDVAVRDAEVALCAASAPEVPVATVRVDEVFEWDRAETAAAVFGTSDTAHPGVAAYHARGRYAIGGPVRLEAGASRPFPGANLTPDQARAHFAERGWRTVCAFQTRNVPHAGHEDLQKTVLGLVDGLMIQPVIGKKKPGDFRDEVIVAAYQALIGNYFAPGRVLLNVLPTEMRYAGPKEAILHGIMRRNYGCTHIIIGRDHAGVGSYYGEEEAIDKFEALAGELGIEPVCIRGDFWYCRECGRVASDRTCPHAGEVCLSFSGTEIRRMIVEGASPPPEIMRPEVVTAIAQFGSPFVSEGY